MIPVKVEQLFLSNVGFVVLLKGIHDERTLPIFIGAAEAHAIALWINKLEMPRPMTHDLLKNVLDCIECRIRRVEISDLKEGTFFARLIIESSGMDIAIDSRPSDAIALSLRASAPIFVAEPVMDEAGRVFEEGKAEKSGDQEPSPKKQDEPVSEVDLLRRDLELAVREERYEDAASLRDKINKIRTEHARN